MQTLQTKQAAEPQKVTPKVDVARKPAALTPGAQGFEAGRAALSPASAPLKPASMAPQAPAKTDPVKAPPPPQRDLPDPAVVKKDGVADPYAYQKNTRGAALYGTNGVQVSDVRQGAIGDCFLAAALAAVAGTNPSAITGAIKDNGDGTYTVRFYNLDWSGSKKAESITVDADLPMNGDAPAYAKSTESLELWPSILEKAYAQWKGSYDAIGHGGNAGDVMEALTGERSRSKSTGGDTDALWTRMKEATEQKKPMCAGSGDKDDAKYKDPKAGVYGWHAYTVLGVEEKKNGDTTEKLVKLRNPWAVRRRSADAAAVGDAENKAEFTLTYAEFRRLYDDVYFNG